MQRRRDVLHCIQKKLIYFSEIYVLRKLWLTLSRKVNKQSDTVSEVCHKAEQIICQVAVCQESVSLLKVWIYEEVSCAL